jgi:hypothetical protein
LGGDRHPADPWFQRLEEELKRLTEFLVSVSPDIPGM